LLAIREDMRVYIEAGRERKIKKSKSRRTHDLEQVIESGERGFSLIVAIGLRMTCPPHSSLSVPLNKPRDSQDFVAHIWELLPLNDLAVIIFYPFGLPLP
jgi:hypothetical protein